MPTSACSKESKGINYGCVFFGFLLHHLFMHMNHLGRHSSSAPFGALQRVIIGVWWCSRTLRMGRGEGEGAVERILDMHRHRYCTMNAEIARGPGFEFRRGSFTVKQDFFKVKNGKGFLVIFLAKAFVKMLVGGMA